MKHMKYVFIMALGWPVFSQAALFVEPAITYQAIDTTVDWGTGLGNSTGKNNGLGVNARVGFHFSDVIFAGLDARYAITKFEDSAVNTNVNAKSMDLGPFVGIQMPIVGLRVWASYVMLGEIDPDRVTETLIDYDAKFSEASGYRIGAGFHIVMVSLNLEYQDLKYNNVSATTSLGTINPNSAAAKGVILSVSFPIAL